MRLMEYCDRVFEKKEITAVAESLTVDEVCIVKLTVDSAVDKDVFYGWAKKHPKDIVNVKVAQTVALSRAFEAAAHHYTEISQYLVAENCGEFSRDFWGDWPTEGQALNRLSGS